MFGIKQSKTNQLRKPIMCKTNGWKANYSYWNMQIEIQLGKASTCATVKLY